MNVFISIIIINAKYHSEDYKVSAVKHYLNKTNNLTKTCEEFNCSRISLKRWVDKYKKDGSIKRYNRKSISYKITENQVKYSLKILKKNQQITMSELVKLIKKKYKDFDITPQHIGKVLRDNNKIRKRTRHHHHHHHHYHHHHRHHYHHHFHFKSSSV